MYTKHSISQKSEAVRLPEHYSGVTFAKQESNDTQDVIQQINHETEIEENQEKNDCSVDATEAEATQKHGKFIGISGKEDMLLLILAILLLDEDGGDDTLAYILLGLLFLS